MELKYIQEPLRMTIAGLGATAPNKDYVGTIFALSGKTWELVKTNQLPNKGKNIWVYDKEDRVFAGLELESATDPSQHGLETKQILIPAYAWYKHVGPYSLLKQVGQQMKAALAARGLYTSLPYIEIYGHWNADESKLETELIMSIV